VSVTSVPPEWGDYLASRAEATVYHEPAWGEVMRRTYRKAPYYLTARRDGRVVGVLQLLAQKSILFGSYLCSLPYFDASGVLADDAAARDALVQRAGGLRAEARCRWVEFRQEADLGGGLPARTDKVRLELSLPATKDELWDSLKAKVRNQVRKAEKSGIEAVIGGTELLDGFYRVYTARMRQLGTPAYSRRLMEAVLETFPDNTRIIAVRLRGLTVGAGLTTCSRNYAEMLYAAALTEYHQLCPNNLLYWTAITHYCRMGVRCFDFGRSTMDSGTHRFKQQWGPQEVNLHYQYWVRPGRELAMAIPNGARYRRKVEMWKKLPLWLTRLVGPMISRGLP
jgi:FemAB-related protein (PEP-CTERM system-associated)